MASIAPYDSYAGYYAQSLVSQVPPDAAFIREYYRILYAYYQQNGLYTYLNNELQSTLGIGASLKPIRNPAWRVVEFYASKIWPGTLPDALPITTRNTRIIDAIQQVWTWSNFSSVKQRWARWFAIYGDWFIKVATRSSGPDPTSVYLTLIDPGHVSEFDLDERGFLTWIRIDVPVVDDDTGATRTYTETWSKGDQELRVWESHRRGIDAKLSQLGEPDLLVPFSQVHGEDFIPIVYQQFRDDGAGRGGGAFSAQLDKIDEANRQATRLAQILFRHNRPMWVVTTAGGDEVGRPLPPPDFTDSLNDGQLQLMGDDMINLPAGSDLRSLVPQVNFGDALAVLQDQVAELVRDLPELAYYDLRDMGDLSGRAVRFLLDDLISRVVEARGNAESGLIRAQEMALTVGQNLGLFDGLGSWEAGDFEHQFDERPVLPRDDMEVATLIQTLTAAGASIFAAAKAAGMSDQEAQDLAQVDLFGLELARPEVPAGREPGDIPDPVATPTADEGVANG